MPAPYYPGVTITPNLGLSLIGQDEVIAENFVLLDAAVGTGGGVTSVFGRTGAVVAVSGDYSVAQITGAAPLASPAFTGNPTAPTQLSSDNSTRLATTAFVQGLIVAAPVTSVFGRTGAVIAVSGDYSFSLISGQASLTTQVSGILPIANGGTGAATVAAGTLFGNSSASVAAPAFTRTPVLGLAGTAAGTLGFSGVTSGTAILQSQDAAGTPTIKLGTASGNVAISASFTGGLITGGSASAAGDIGLTVAGTSGGIPYFSSASAWASSAVLTASRLVLGGGAGSSPTVLGSLGTTTTVLHGNAAGAPTFGAVDLTADVTGILPGANEGITINAQTGTSYTFLDTDRGKLVTFSNAASIAVTLPQAGAAASFLTGWYTDFKNIGAGTVTITPTTSTVDGSAKVIVPPGATARILSNGTNYIMPYVTVDTNAAGGSFIANLNADMVLYGAAVAIVSTANAVIGFTVNIDKAFLMNKILARATGNTSGSSQTFDIGIYDSQGNKIFSAGAQTVGNGAAANLNATTTATIFLPGAYKFVWTASATTVTFVGGQANLVGGQNAGTTAAAINANFIKLFSAANAVSAGVLPTTLGVLTSALGAGDTSGNVPTMLFET